MSVSFSSVPVYPGVDHSPGRVYEPAFVNLFCGTGCGCWIVPDDSCFLVVGLWVFLVLNMSPKSPPALSSLPWESELDPPLGSESESELPGIRFRIGVSVATGPRIIDGMFAIGSSSPVHCPRNDIPVDLHWAPSQCRKSHEPT